MRIHYSEAPRAPAPCRGPGVRASSPQAAKMAALPGSGQASGPRRGPPDRSREAHATICITRPKRGFSAPSPLAGEGWGEGGNSTETLPRQERLSEYVFKRLSFPTISIKFPTLLNLTYQYRIAQNVERFFQTFVFRKVDQHGRGFSLPCYHDFFFSLLNTSDKLGKTCLYFGNRESLRHSDFSLP